MDASLSQQPGNLVQKDQRPVNPGKLFPSRSTAEEFYDVDYENKGIMLIFNQYEFENSVREGSEKDLNKLKETFTNVGYEVRDYTDKTSEKIKDILQEVSEEDHTENMSIIVVMLTHGGPQGLLLTYDSAILVDDLWKPFTADKCPTLAGKPKLFFLQACKGKKADPGSTVALASKANKSKATSKKEIFVIPTMADILIFYSTSEGYVSFRTSRGSWFIQSLCDRFSEYLIKERRKVELTRILHAVSRDVAFGRQAAFNNDVEDPEAVKFDASKQMPTVMSTLTKFLVFNSGEVLHASMVETSL